MTQKLLIQETDPQVARLDFILAQRINMSPRTKSRYRRALARAVEAQVNMLDPAAAAAWGNQLTSSNRSFFRAALRLLGDRLAQEIKTNVTPETVLEAQAALMRIEVMIAGVEKVVNKGHKAHRWLTKAELSHLLHAPDTSTMKGRRDYIVLALAVGAGLRREEVVSLTWTDVVSQGDRVVLNVKGKGAKDREVPLSKVLAGVLEIWRGLIGEGRIARSVGKSGRMGSSLSGVGVLDIVTHYGRLIGIADLQPHDLRRTYAQIGYDAGVPIKQISMLLGHSSVSTTERYLNVLVDKKLTISDFIPLMATGVGQLRRQLKHKQPPSEISLRIMASGVSLLFPERSSLLQSSSVLMAFQMPNDA